jgi:hypothetical protein
MRKTAGFSPQNWFTGLQDFKLHMVGGVGSRPQYPLARWRRSSATEPVTFRRLIEDATKNPEDVQAAEKELAEFKKAMNENRASSGEPVLYP